MTKGGKAQGKKVGTQFKVEPTEDGANMEPLEDNPSVADEFSEEEITEECDNTFKVPDRVPREHKPRVYLPGKPIRDDEELVHDPSAYIMLHECQTGAPCLSFDVIPDNHGNNREVYPMTAFYVGGTQAERANGNSIIVMKVTNLTKTWKESEEDESSSSSSSEADSDDSDEEEQEKEVKGPQLKSTLIKHHGCVNRIRVRQVEERMLCGVWSELGKVTVLDLSPQLTQLNTPGAHGPKKKGVGEPIRPLHVFPGHQTEGYALDWSPLLPGVLASGDCRRNIHLWRPAGSTWHVDQRPLVGHTASVEDIQWSPNEPNVMASCSVDKTIRIWDTRETGSNACKLTVEEAHSNDINVISWNRREPLIVSGGDDGVLHVWDLRNFKRGESVATLKHHSDSVTTVEWCPQESSVFASGGADDQIAIWDLAVERDPELAVEDSIKDLPQQLLFIHQGQQDVKELHWHPQIPGLLTSTANSGFNFFKTISV